MRRFALAAVVLWGAQAHAYLIPAESVFNRFAAKQALEKVEEAPLTGRAVVDSNDGQKRVQARVQVRYPGECELTLEFPESEARAHLAHGNVSVEGTPVPALEALAALGCPLATMKTVPAHEAEKSLQSMAKRLGVDTSVVALRRLNGRTAWVVGAKPLDETSPQLWFDKQTQRPVRIIARHAGTLWDVRYEDVRSRATGRRHPRIAEVWQGDTRVLSLRLMTAIDEPPAEEEPDEEQGDDASEE